MSQNSLGKEKSKEDPMQRGKKKSFGKRKCLFEKKWEKKRSTGLLWTEGKRRETFFKMTKRERVGMKQRALQAIFRILGSH